MVLLIGLALAVIFSLTCDKFIKKHANILYIVCAVVSIAISFINTRNLPAFVNTYIIGLFSRGAFATSLWIVVMWTGALKNGSKLIKKLMSIRGELSIMAGILTLAHNISFGKTYFVRLFTSASSMSATHIAAAIMSLIMMLIMIPLTIMSFPKIRKKMNGKLWKKIQRTAYAFYALIYLHVMTLYLPMTQKGQLSYWVGVLIYSIIFISYAVCRIRKWYILRKKPENTKVVNVISAVAAIVLIAVISIIAFPSSQNYDTTVTTNNTTQSSDSQTTEITTEADTEATTKETSEKPTEKVTEEATEGSTEESTEAATEATEAATNENNTAQNEEQVIIYEQTNGNTQQSDTQQTQTQDNITQNTQQSQQTTSQNNTQQSQQTQQVQQPMTEKVYVYNNGTYTATAFGYDGNVEVSVTIENDIITNITGTTYESDDWYFNTAKSSVFSQIISTQQTNVDAYSGATYSSKAIMTAVQTALNSARK